MSIIGEVFKGVRKFFAVPVLALLVVVAGGAAAYSYSLYQKSQAEVQRLQNPQEVAKADIAKVVESVKNLMELPSDEQPTIATVVDAGKLKDQPFFVRSENGDKLLIYTQARKAILYRPTTNKVVEVAPVNIGPTEGQIVRVALYNGTDTAGATASAEEKLKKEVKNLQIVKKDAASRQDYEGITVVDVRGNQKGAADQMARVLGARVESLPDGEAKPDADLLVIVGK